MSHHRIYCRPASSRPVMTQAQVIELNKRVLAMTSADTVRTSVVHTSRVVMRIANDRVRPGDDGDGMRISIITRFGERAGVFVETNQLSDSTLLAVVQRCEALARQQIGRDEVLRFVGEEQDVYPRVNLWHDTTVEAMHTAREKAAPAILDAVTSRGLRTAGFVGIMARVRSMLTKEGITAFCEETDCEVTVTARSPDGSGPGWAGEASRDWSGMHVQKIAERASRMAMMNRGAQAVEPGRRTAILGPAAVVQMLRYLAVQFDAFDTDTGSTALSKTVRGGNKLGQRIFDPRVTLRSDPSDPDGGYKNYFAPEAVANPAMTWVSQGVLRNLAYSPQYAMERGKQYADCPYSMRMDGGPTSLDAMIASCEEGIYVNRLSNVDLVDKRTGMLTGVTSDGCFFVKHGKIDRPVKNFRILDSPFFFLNNIEALGATARAAFGYTPRGRGEMSYTDWPRPPLIVPPIMVRDFNFSSLADAV
jgi:predicted Zn-dependent protease